MTLRAHLAASEAAWLTKREAAAYLRCGLRTLERRMAARQVRYYRDGSLIRFLRADLDALMQPVQPVAVEVR